MQRQSFLEPQYRTLYEEMDLVSEEIFVEEYTRFELMYRGKNHLWFSFLVYMQALGLHGFIFYTYLLSLSLENAIINSTPDLTHEIISTRITQIAPYFIRQFFFVTPDITYE